MMKMEEGELDGTAECGMCFSTCFALHASASKLRGSLLAIWQRLLLVV
jgi:hypothetical protein